MPNHFFLCWLVWCYGLIGYYFYPVGWSSADLIFNDCRFNFLIPPTLPYSSSAPIEIGIDWWQCLSSASSTEIHRPPPDGYLPPVNALPLVFTTFVLLKIDSMSLVFDVVYTRLSKIDRQSHPFSKIERRHPGKWWFIFFLP